MNKRWLFLAALSSCLGCSPASNASELKGKPSLHSEVQSSKGYGPSSLVVSSLGGFTLGGLVSGLTVHNMNKAALDEVDKKAKAAEKKVSDAEKKVDDLQKQNKKLIEENKKLKNNKPHQPIGFSEDEKKEMQDKIDQLENNLKQKQEDYDKLVSQGGGKDAIVLQLQNEIKELKKQVEKDSDDFWAVSNKLHLYEQSVGSLDKHVKFCPDLKYKLDYLKTYFRTFYDTKYFGEVVKPTRSMRDTPLLGFDDDDLGCLKTDEGVYSMFPLEVAFTDYVEHMSKKGIENLKDEDYQKFLMKGFSNDKVLDYKKIFLNLRLLYTLLGNTSNLVKY